MEKSEFLAQNIFIGLKNMNDGFDDSSNQYFTESDFELALQRIEHFGIGVFIIETRLDSKQFETFNHETFKKKATDPKWYNKAFMTLQKRQTGLLYFATYKVSKKLLER